MSAGQFSPQRLADEIEMHEQLLSVHLASFDREVKCGDQAKQDEQLAMAANHAAILTALKDMRGEVRSTPRGFGFHQW